MTHDRLKHNRRRFLKTLFAGSALLATPLPRRVAWADQGAGKGNLRFGFYTDVHARAEWDTPLGMARAAEAINAQHCDFLIAGGDLITDGFQSSLERVSHRWDLYMEMHRSLRGDIYPVMGNHDLVAAIPEDGTPPSLDPRSVFRAKLGLEKTIYSFDAVGYHFIVVDSVKITGGKLKYEGNIGPDQIEWIKSGLSRLPTGTPLILCTHFPLLTTFYAATQGATSQAPPNRVIVNNREVLEIFQGHNLILVLQGHLHVDEFLRWRGTTFIMGGAVCARWWRGPWHGTQEGFGVVTLKDNRVEWEYIDYGWEAKRV